jgi:predicted acyltransferase
LHDAPAHRSREPAERSAALDALRGLAVALMIFVNNPGSWNHVYPPLQHAAWHGCTPADLVFPIFLFAVGVSMAFAQRDAGTQRGRIFWPPVWRRTALIFLIGLLLNEVPFVGWSESGALVMVDGSQWRVMGVLQRIALASVGAAACVRWLGARHAGWAAAVLLLAYWGACMVFGDPADPYRLEGFFGTALDRSVLSAGHLYRGEGVPFDPEGLAGTVPAIAQVLIGWMAGRRLARGAIDEALVARLFVTAAWLLVLGYAWQLVMPLNKKMWTSSFVLHGCGIALALLALLVHTLDVQRVQGAWRTVLVALGRNAMLIYVLSMLVPRLLELLRWREGEGWNTPMTWLYDEVFAALPGDPRFGSMVFALAVTAAFAVLALVLDRRRWYWRV